MKSQSQSPNISFAFRRNRSFWQLWAVPFILVATMGTVAQAKNPIVLNAPPANPSTEWGISRLGDLFIVGLATEISVNRGDGGIARHAAVEPENSPHSSEASAAGTVKIQSRAVDESGNLQEPATAAELVVADRNELPGSTIWPDSEAPAVPSEVDSKAVELGMKFRSDVDGYVTGIRFYKRPSNSGTHVGNLWTRDRTLLGMVTFASETASGWQYAALPNPVPIAANTTYVVSYHAPNGGYSLNSRYFAGGGVSNPPLRALGDGEDGGNGVYRYGDSGFPDQSSNASNYWVDVVFEESPSSDNKPPTVTAVSPVEGATEVHPNATVSVVFSEPMDAATINSGTIVLRDGSGTLMPATVSYGSAPFTAVLTPGSPLELAAKFTVTAMGGAGGVTDVTGNPLEADYEWSFTTAVSVPATIWADTAIPKVPSDNDSKAVELGTKFRSDVDGYVTGIRFYKGSSNTGTHAGNLWTANGTLLGSVTFASETASGWQHAALSNPVPIAANTTYVVSYYAPNGGYSADAGYFAGRAVSNPPLRALGDGEDGGNGVYRYGDSGFPDQSSNASNYWVDVGFEESPSSDNKPPTVTSVSPVEDAKEINPNATVSVVFSEPMDAATINSGTIVLRDGSGTLMPATVSYGSAPFTAVLTPGSPLELAAKFTVTAMGGAGGVTDVTGNPLEADYEWSFTTAESLPATIWADTAIPKVPSDNDSSAVELGTKFRSDVDGYVTGIRFYKGPSNTGRHVGNLWTANGTLLGSVTFASETAGGWQYAALPNPVPIAANTTYVVSYYAPNGGYSADAGYFSGDGVSNPPLRALGDGEEGGNGVYRYGDSGFPDQSSNANNYWVDVVFEESLSWTQHRRQSQP